MKIRTKLTLIFAAVFLVLLAVGGLGSYYLRWLAQDTEAIIQDNYRTLTYMHALDNTLDELLGQLNASPTNETRKQVNTLLEEGRARLDLQQENITEMGENSLTSNLIRKYEQLQDRLTSNTTEIARTAIRSELVPLILDIKDQAAQIYEVNEDALLKENEQAVETAHKVVLYMTILVGCTCVLGIFFTVGFPKVLTRPIKDFIWAVREVSLGNYQTKVPHNRYDELGDLARAFNSMAAKLQEYKVTNVSSLLFEKKRLDAVIDQMHEATLGLDENKFIIFVNNRMLNLLNMNREKIIGKYAPDIAVKNDLLKSLIRELMIGVDEWEEQEFTSIKAVENDQQKLFAKQVVDVVDEPTGESRRVLIGHVVMLTDITEFAERDEAKTHFMATLSHELKTPTAAIQMSADLLQNTKIGALNEEQASLLTTIRENNERMQHIIREILDLSKIESGAIDVSRVAVDPVQLIDKAIEGVKLFLNDKHLQIEKIIASPLGLVRVDPHKTVWVLNNFLTNAIRYAPENSHIIIGAQQDNGHIKIKVQDQGPGISPSNQQRIFEKFSRIQDEQSEGTGLGLAISKEFVKAMYGQIGVQSEEGQGSIFWISFPIIKAEIYEYI
ncbi:ATP-binding protein [Catalinimonas sp. 4WD22]|uniref:sensor histidine kinase n=1 Tax=Catalinimonas locisalis TaxID=3133978 RepID=UPI003100B026